MRSFKVLIIALIQCQLCVHVLSDAPCTPNPPLPLSDLPDLVHDLYLNSTHWNPNFCGDWRYGSGPPGTLSMGAICVRVYCDTTSESPLDAFAIESAIDEAIQFFDYQEAAASFTNHSWSANDPTGQPGLILRIAEWEKRPGLLSNVQAEIAVLAMRRYWRGPPYEQSDFLIYHDGAGVIGGGSGRRPPRLGPGIVNAVLDVN